MQAQEADHILIPLLNGDYTLAQIAALDETIAQVFVTQRRMTQDAEVIAFGTKDIKGAVFVDLAQIPIGHWPIIGYEPIPKLEHDRPDTQTVDGRSVHDPAVIEAFANALHGLYPWDGFSDADFFTAMLCESSVIPSRARMVEQLAKPGDL